ncbi:phosphotransferase family protein [Streptomyces profundus]|uniref:phosphotransferase family protein n=1 Tax=Streptomyces profundus TaxID=2867410 RepID=UPI001D163E2A|nr:aminoglycoside phosphotransferase family protein [Streptomyces sp. MA3_2.13]UED86777.1 aminoglycoside phosphotransferase family protein [Streptomyces sp. MA3_2.13]
MQRHDEKWIDYFAARGHASVAPLAAGMEGSVYALDATSVAKVWAVRSGEELARLRRFYDALAATELSFRTPRITEVLAVDGQFVSVEERLHGTPLDERDAQHPEVLPRGAAAMLDVLDQLGRVDAPALRGLAVLDEEHPFWAGHATWPEALTALIERRLARFGDVYRSFVPGFDAKVRRMLALVAGLDVPLGLLHGDLVPPNLLVDDELRVASVLDFGFLSTVGDPVFDLAVTASVYDMYSPAARRTERLVDGLIAERFDAPPERMALYRAVYGVVAGNVFDPLGQDGHFRFCADQLTRPEVADLLG